MTAVLRRVLTALLVLSGLVAWLTLGWLLAGLPLGFDRGLNASTPPARSEVIVCIGGGTLGRDVPTNDGWQRIYTSADLFADGYAPVVVFTGRGNSRVSEAEIYADAATWLGMPRDAIRLDPLPASTAEHPASLLESLAGLINRNSRVLLVTSALHSRRVLMTFRKHGFTNVSVVSGYRARSRLPGSTRTEVSTLPTYTHDNKRYDDPLFTITQRSSTLLMALREWSAIAVYKWKGYL